jgi:hypothetical protein
MSAINYYPNPESTYPVFEPDQVLTNKHLNAAFTHLQRQEEFTRNKLIGMGIVNGLQSSWDGSNITITAGTGITSAGYLIVFNGAVYSHCREYSLPEFPETMDPALHEEYAEKKLLQLVPVNQAKAGDVQLKDKLNELTNLVVMLLHEPFASDLKNCTTDDCNDKGRQVNITIRPLLVKTEDLVPNIDIIPQQDVPVWPEIHMKRWNVPSVNIQHPANIVEAYDAVLDAELVKELNKAFTFIYDVFNPLFSIAGDETLKKVGDIIEEKRVLIRTTNPLFSQYVYDYASDLIHAYYDFCAVVFDITEVFTADAQLFPLHLALGHTVLSSATDRKNYRSYFTAAPLSKQDRYREACVLYTRLVQMLQQFSLPDKLKEVRITPSYLGDGPLGKHCIPFYYNAKALYPYWDFNKSRYGRSKLNRSYFASQYSTDLAATSPLLYDSGHTNFFRIEGHIGLQVQDAIKALNTIKTNNQLPFDIVALNLYATSTLPGITQLSAHFTDLESQYNLLLNELLGRMNSLYADISHVPFTMQQATSVLGKIDTKATNYLLIGGPFSEAWPNTATVFIKKIQDQQFYKKGTYLQFFCQANVNNATIGGSYLRWVSLLENNGKLIEKPGLFNINEGSTTVWTDLSYKHYFYLIDVLEELLVRVAPYNLSEINLADFKERYKKVMDALNGYAAFFDAWKHATDILADKSPAADNTVITEEIEYYRDVESVVVPVIADCRSLMQLCFDERLNQLRQEYSSRCQYVLDQHIFSHYAKLYPGLEHKSGVTTGGTFVLVYFDKTDIVEAPGPQDNTIDRLIEQGAVSADFYIPGVRATTYAPVATLFEGTPDDTPAPVIFMAVRSFCNLDNTNYQLTLSPDGNVPSGPGNSITKDAGNKYYFSPVGLGEGDYTLSYSANNKTSYLTINIKAALDTGFQIARQAVNADKTGITVWMVADVQSGQHSWTFGNGENAIGVVNPVQTYLLKPGETKNFIVSHTVTNDGACTKPPMQKTLTLKLDDVPVTVSMTTTDLCTNAGLTRIFYAPSGGTMSCPEKPGAVILLGGLYYFNTGAAGTGTFTLHYEMDVNRKAEVKVTVKPASSADFSFSLTSKATPVIKNTEPSRASFVVTDPGTYYNYLLEVNSDVKDGAHEWTLSDGQKALGANTRFSITVYVPGGVIQGSASFTATHKITKDGCTSVVSKVVWQTGNGGLETM